MELNKENTNKDIYQDVPVITLRGIVLYPGINLQFDIVRKQSILALYEAVKKDQKVFFVTQKDFSIENPGIRDLYKIGVTASVLKVEKNEDESINISVRTENKARAIKFYKENEFFKTDIKIFENKPFKETEYLQALIKTAKDIFNRYCELVKNIPKDIVMTGLRSKNAIFVAEYISSHTLFDIEAKQQILAYNNAEKKLELLIEELNHELNLIFIERDILDKLNYQIDKNQKEYYLREQLKVISQELGEESPIDEKNKYEEKIKDLKLKDKTTEKKLLNESYKLSKLSSNSPEASVIKNYLDTCLELPWNKISKDKIDIKKAQKLLDQDHYGLNDVKERIIELLSVIKLKKEVNGLILCLCGPPGVGKTSIVKSIAKTMNREFVKISLGGVKDESDIRGHRKTYIGSMPGRIIEAMNTAGVKNPLILLDEIDKMSNDFRGDPSSAMLEVLDSEQNNSFVDHYLEVPFDLSDVLFIATANDKYSIPAPLLDRMEIIDMSSYTENEKFHIAKNHLIKKQLKVNGLTSKDVKIEDDVIFEIINYYTSEAGVRNLERKIAKVLRKVVQSKISDEDNLKKEIISKANLSQYLGPKKYKPERILEHDEVGIATGLAWTSVGGEVMHIEVSALEGSGKLELTGNLGDVMKESAKTAISFVRSKSRALGIEENFYKNKDIHIHVPEGAVPKDGPSAGVTICTAIVSELTNKPVRRDIAMTGEITLRGRVLPIGGLKEKTMAAYKTGIKTVYIPKENEPDLHEVDPVVKKAINFVSIDKVENILNTALVSH